jgi:hypothetical protein
MTMRGNKGASDTTVVVLCSDRGLRPAAHEQRPSALSAERSLHLQRVWAGREAPTPMHPKEVAALTNLPDTGEVLPVQFFPASDDHRWEGEKGVMFATLEQAVKDFQTLAYIECKQADFEELLAWFQDTDLSWPYSYQNICDQLDIDADRIRKALFAWRAANPTKPVSPFVRRKCHSKDNSHGRKHPSRRDRPCHA